MPRIEEMYAFVAADKDPDDEGIVGMNTGSGWMPMVGADMKRVDDLRPIALSLAYGLGIKIKLLHFTKREELEVIG